MINNPQDDSVLHTLYHYSLGISQSNLSLSKKLDAILDDIWDKKDILNLNKIVIFTTRNNELKVEGCKGFSGKLPCNTLPFNECHCGQAAALQQNIYSTEKPPLSPSTSPTETFFHCCIPIINGGISVGTIAAYLTIKPENKTKTIEVMENIAGIISSAIANENLLSQLHMTTAGLKKEQNFSESIFQFMSHGLLVCNENNVIIKCNQAAKMILHDIAKEPTGKSIYSIFNSISVENYSANIIGNESAEKILHLTPHEKSNSYITYSSTDNLDDIGTVTGKIISISDVTESMHHKKDMEKMNRLATVAEIASAVAHEVRNPLAGIKIMAQSIEEEASKDSEAEECSKRIIRQVDRLNKLLSDFFSYARPGTPEIRCTDLVNVINETAHLVKKRLFDANIDFDFAHEDGLPLIMADGNQMQQVLLNLFLNAMQAMEGKGRITISAQSITKTMLRSYRQENNRIKAQIDDIALIFADNGKGMNKDLCAKIFEPFFTTRSNGTGLGLAIVYRTLKENGASVLLRSSLGKGTVFTILLKKGEES
ncbi:MAG: ATP-binding protein [Desulfotalea sp.]